MLIAILLASPESVDGIDGIGEDGMDVSTPHMQAGNSYKINSNSVTGSHLAKCMSRR